ncbi:hypothetical protein [Dethiothermospora halolimnae]|uniref:hypothetical protein n=1 Tax=Dethiothermospora halolimnae TaxID=3114390 RepID=UPI003CCBB0A6
MPNKKRSIKFDNKDVSRHYDDGKDDNPIRDTFRNVIDSNTFGEPEKVEDDKE